MPGVRESGAGAWWLLVAAKLWFLIWAAIGCLAPLQQETFAGAHARWMSGDEPTLATRVAAWDAAHYLKLARVGYESGDLSCAFYPLWPIVLRPFLALPGDGPVWAAWILANALSAAGLFSVYELWRRRFGPAVARDAWLLLLFYPGALFFSVPYSEPLFFALIMLFFWGCETDRWRWVAFSAFLLPLARPIGILVLLPLVWVLWERGWPAVPRIRRAVANRGNRLAMLRQSRRIEQPRAGTASEGLTKGPAAGDSAPRVTRPEPCVGVEPAAALAQGIKRSSKGLNGWLAWGLLGALLAGYAFYFVLMYLWTGNALEGFDIQKVLPNEPSIGHIFKLTGFWQALTSVQDLDGYSEGLLDRLFFVAAVLSLPWLWRLDRPWFSYVLGAGLVPALTTWFCSYRRYAVVLFPVFLVWAFWLRRIGPRWMYWYYVIFLAGLQAWATFSFFTFHFAG
ncbi:hypothetical protein ACPDIX_01185 [Limisphaera sp. 4302-co]